MNSIKLLIRYVVAAVLLYAAFSKLLTTEDGRSIYHNLCANFPVLKFVVPITEIALGASFICGWPIRFSTIATLVLLSMFTGLITLQLREPAPKPCGCMASSAHPVEDLLAIRNDLRLGLARNIAMMGGLAFLLLSSSQRSVFSVVAPSAETPNNDDRASEDLAF